MEKKELAQLLALDDFSPVYEKADAVRRENVGDEVHIRAIIEFSNICGRKCRYCGLNSTNKSVIRYRMSPEEILDTARQAIDAGYRTIVLQSGEDPCFHKESLGQVVKEIKKAGAAVTLSCGELTFEELEYLRDCGADRYLLKHETADPELYKQLHPCGTLEERVTCLENIYRLGYETGSGFMIGLPGQTLETIADDLLLLQKLHCAMAGIGPFIPHPDTPLGKEKEGSPELTKRAVALARLLLPKANLPVTTSLGVINQKEKENAFACGANVIMKKVTPDPYKEAYEIYPAKLEKTDIKKDRKLLEEQIRGLGRIPL
ncbi:[FeFe] hydrogenase H-cluster radical SAM maturase HydE [Anaerovorax odorimutans]|uniref:[FeFe] hydrogenase H-cluster radical SAM maturase HydE n=1 Tax=Anaerovorax odorimutans TaxID=109327 RepID=A0ABT1RSZ5_9FIRM|nr:[FeFe] hydrogenase H-cluster radical SAM maturase HydE [Anaerovorax odorimutans]MCQ4638329.1 [FeFe] hydrogenase H-cluster radical SAM maturase HydE [Anaerovorax odorimutans]